MINQIKRNIRRYRAALCARRQATEAFRRRRDLARHRSEEIQRIAELERRARGARLYAAWCFPAIEKGGRL
jgi:hypothetical protein